MSLLKTRDYYKPFAYPEAYNAYKVMQSMHWLPHEAPMAEDIKDWNSRLTDNERSLLTQLFRFFTQADVDIARGYYEKYAPRFPHPEIRMMMGSFIAAEANHIDAYSTLIDTLGLSEGEYKAFQQYKAMREKHEYMFDRETGTSIADLAVDMAVFSAFGEGMQLFSSFAILLSFQQRGLMKGMTTIVEWSIRDETHHVESMVWLFKKLIEEHPRVWNDETKQRIYETCRQMVKLEDAFIDQAFSIGPVEGITAKDAKQYIRYIADRRLLQLGLKPNYRVKENPLPWLDWIMNAPTHTNFFEQRSTEYGKGEIAGWDRAFDFLTGVKRPVYRVYTMPGCPHCARAVEALESATIPYEAILIEDADLRAAMKAKEPGWKTFPMVYFLDAKGTNSLRFVGGADALVAELVTPA
jgi:ribonucleoside-diphosphate reductase beta chain